MAFFGLIDKSTKAKISEAYQFTVQFEQIVKTAGGIEQIRKRDPDWLLKEFRKCKGQLNGLYHDLRKKKLSDHDIDLVAAEIERLDSVKQKIKAVF